MKETTILKGNIVHAPALGQLQILEQSYLVAEEGRIVGLYAALPEAYLGRPVEDHGERLIVPSFSDMHLHAPQYPMLGLGMDLQLLEWLDTYTFRTESRFQDAAFAREVYRRLARALIEAGTTRVVAFSSIHREATHVLMEELAAAGVTGYVGKVNMDRNSPDYLSETTEESLFETRRWLEECKGRYQHIEPILTPRFTPSCTDALMEGLGALREEFGVRVQSHLSENLDEIAWVKELRPDCKQYWETYETAGLFGEDSVMAHCIYSDARERAAMRERRVLVAHCPESNINIASGIAPVRRMLREGLRVALGSDIAGGATLSMAGVATAAIRASKRNWLNTNKQEEFLTVAEAFYLITSAGQEYFGAGPGFQPGDALHALVLDDAALPPSGALAVDQRLERLMYLMRPGCIKAVYSEGIERLHS